MPANGGETRGNGRHSGGWWLRVLVAGWLTVAAVACDPGAFVSEPPPATCTQIGAQCQLAAGPLGVCESAPCAAGATPPCLVCISQH
jgi:hypothetical protein